MAHIDSFLWSSVIENGSKRSKAVYTCAPCQIVSSISSSWGVFNSLTPPKTEFTDEFELRETIGKGSFSIVRKAINYNDSNEYAIKIIRKRKLTKTEKSALKSEVKILRSINHPDIMSFYSFHHDEKNFYLTTEYLRGGSLFERIKQKGSYDEKEASQICQILLGAISYCHKKRIAHRDLKPENLLLVSASNDLQIKIADFGLAKLVPEKGGLRTRCGTANYIAPEIISGTPYTTQVDMWSIGVIIFVLLSGQYPFGDTNSIMLYRKIRAVNFNFSKDVWDTLSDEAKDMISKLLVRYPQHRLNADAALQHSWLIESTAMDDNDAKFEKKSVTTGSITASDTASEEMSSSYHQFVSERSNTEPNLIKITYFTEEEDDNDSFKENKIETLSLTWSKQLST